MLREFPREPGACSPIVDMVSEVKDYFSENQGFYSTKEELLKAHPSDPVVIAIATGDYIGRRR